MEERVYMHTVNNRYFNSRRDIKVLSSILDSNAILSLRRQGKSHSSSFAGLDYISLCDYEKRKITNNDLLYYNSFYAYIRHGISLAFDKKTINSIYEVKEPILLEALEKSNMIHYYMEMLGNEEKRYTDLPDEVQIKDEVSLDYLSYITYPCDEFFLSRLFIRQESKEKKLITELNNLRSVLLWHNKHVNIYDINSGILLDEQGVEKVLRLNK